MSDEEAVTMLESLGILRERGGRPVVLPYLGFSGRDIVEDAHRIRRIADPVNAIYADFYTLVRPGIMAPSARRLVANQRPEDVFYYPEARAALSNLRPGNLEAAREVYRLAPRAGQA